MIQGPESATDLNKDKLATSIVRLAT